MVIPGSRTRCPPVCCREDIGVELRIGVIGEDSFEELRSLRSWLLSEEMLRGSMRNSSSVVRPGEMGTAVDVLTVAVGSGGVLAVLARSVSAWFEHRRPDISLEIQTSQGQSLKLDAKRSRDAVALLKVMQDAIDRTDKG